MNDFTFNIVIISALIPIVQGVVEVLKSSFLPSKLAPLVSILLGVGAIYLVGGVGNTGMTVMTGVVTGLSSAGLYSFTKSNLERKFATQVEDENKTPVVGSDIGGDKKVVVPTNDPSSIRVQPGETHSF